MPPSPSAGRDDAARYRPIVRAAAGGDVGAVVDAAARLVGGWGAYADPDGEVAVISDGTYAPAAAAWAERLMRLSDGADGAGPDLLYGEDGARGTCAAAVRVDGTAVGAIVLSTVFPARAGGPDQTTLRGATAMTADVLDAVLPQAAAASRRLRRLRSACMAVLRDGNGAAVLPLVGQLWDTVPVPPLTVGCAAGTPGDLDRLYGRLDSSPSCPFGECAGRMWTVSSAPPDRRTAPQDGPVRDGADSVWGRAEAPSWQALPDAFDRAERERSMAVAGCAGPRTDMSLTELLRPDLAVAYAQELLRPLDDLPDGDRDTMLDLARTLLSTTFGIGETARRLGVHRHTVENRMARLERLLGLDLSQETDRMRLWVACSFLRTR